MELDWHVNRALLPFKAVYFLFLAGYSCLLPYLPVYMHQLGLNIAETGLIRSLEPCVGFVASPILGGLADKHSKHKVLLVVSILGSSLLGFSIIWVPAISESGADGSGTSEGVDGNWTGESGWTRQLNCSLPHLVNSSLCSTPDRTGFCADFCDDDDNDDNDAFFSDAGESPARLAGAGLHLSCLVCMPSETGTAGPAENVTAVSSAGVPAPGGQPADGQTLRIYCLEANASGDAQQSGGCLDRASGDVAHPPCPPSLRGSHPVMRNSSDCFRCTCANATLLRPPSSSLAGASHWYVFTLLAVLVLSSKVFLCNVFPLLDSSLMLVLGSRPQGYGKQRLWGALGWGAFALISGAAIDAASRDSPQADYTVAFYLFIALEALGLLAALGIGLPPHKPRRSMLRDLCGLLSQPNIITFLMVVTVVGMCFGVVQTYLFLFLEELGGPHTLMGLSLTVTCISEVPFLFFAGRIIRRLTHIGVAYLTLLGYALRFLGYSLVADPWLVLPFELLHGFTYGAFWAACTSFAAANAPSGMTTTLQSVISAFHVGVGRGIGTVLGGLVYQEWGSRTLFRVCLFVCLGTAIVYFLLRKFLVDGVRGPLALYRKFSLVRGEPSSGDLGRKDSCLSELDSDPCPAIEGQRMQLTMTTLDPSNLASPPATRTVQSHRPLVHQAQVASSPDSPEDDSVTSAESSSLTKLLRMEDRPPAVGSEVLELRSEGRPPVVGEVWEQRQGGRQTAV